MKLVNLSKRDMLLGAAIIVAAIFLLHYVVRSRVGFAIPGASFSAGGDISLPSGNAPAADVGPAVETIQQSATSADGKFTFGADFSAVPLNGAIPAASL
jgi:hypothetical protein